MYYSLQVVEVEVVNLETKKETLVVQVEVLLDKTVNPHMMISCNIEVEQVQHMKQVETVKMVVLIQQEH